jgi:hypothetical protein
VVVGRDVAYFALVGGESPGRALHSVAKGGLWLAIWFCIAEMGTPQQAGVRAAVTPHRDAAD